ncbi:pilus assembly PilX family protein [Actimicrobium sp. CCI2.3]|uniref:pilus assembly PilX family protein n=1 Tax=Actimicrobium sp. CCI2.3 TaxID=3048616 RepID=UPI002AB40764|nr:PilX N-terminal domain-containing pilus assembly protein [Actimicrobium sp. CCI2.3]MDY7574038.1 PilX N-terminal domain-containing pilus assembly protein [Actimicrobium sp. CCI2.3]MEB0021854.1 PilX N-terminal domain-containing pilus assembly protein [Actimicrobium sp. CCI2.3]
MSRRQSGITLIIVLVWLMAVSLLAMSALQIGLQDQKAARSYRDREIAFQAAEAGLRDAELDIEDSPDTHLSRSALFAANSKAGFPDEVGNDCQRGVSNRYQGLCRQSADASAPSWLQVAQHGRDGIHDSDVAVAYGRFTGRSMQTGVGALPAMLPRYLIELMPYRQAGYSAERPEYFYRITAIGFGADVSSEVVLQTFYRKGSAP